MDMSSRIADLATPGAEAAGLVVDDVLVAPAGKKSRVVVTVDLPEDAVGGAGIDALTNASRAIGAALDDANVPSTPYTLEVSTPGIDRPLTERKHFMRARTRRISVELKDGSGVVGDLTEVEGDDLLLSVDGAERRIGLADVTSASIVVVMKRTND